ncbi:MAG TPA: hypothetical protein VE344_08560 [Methylomirabilota bacterium]|nr:hypothetical protein [Methylomirabilota bacterium]
MTTRFSFIQRYVPLIAWLIVLSTLFVIPLKILSYGFVPPGDARRHIAKAFTERKDSEIIVLRPGFTMDHNPGWEWVLRHAQEATGANIGQMTVFAVIALLLCFFYSALPWLRRPEAWLATLLAEMVALPYLMGRLDQIRPLLVPESILIVLLFVWSRDDSKNPSRLKLVLTAAAFCLSTWIDGAWFLWGFLFAAFCLARRWRDLLWLMACWLVGTIIAAMLTGSPVQFLGQTIRLAATVASEHIPQWILVGEMTPSDGEFPTLVLLAIVFLWRKQQGKTISALLDTPVFWLVVICWILGLHTDRCWADWGIPAVLVWLTLQFEDAFINFCDATSPKRLLLCSFLAFPLFLQCTNDLERRYSKSAGEQFLDVENPALQGWLPDKDGIFYCAQMSFYYDTFYKNPQAGWRYILGYEPAIMPEEDLKILRSIQLTGGAFKSYEPWIQKMRAADRLVIVIYNSSQPDLPQLEWHYAGGGIWIGRLPK